MGSGQGWCRPGTSIVHGKVAHPPHQLTLKESECKESLFWYQRAGRLWCFTLDNEGVLPHLLPPRACPWPIIFAGIFTTTSFYYLSS